MKNNLILLCIVILFAMNLYSLACLKTKEKMTNVNSVTEQTITTLIKKIYKTDVNAIRNLADIADKLQGKGKYKNKEIVLPGNLTIKGNLKINQNLNVNGTSTSKDITATSKLNASSITSRGNITGSSITSRGNITGSSITSSGNLTGGYITGRNLKVGSSLIKNNGEIYGSDFYGNTFTGKKSVSGPNLNNYIKYDSTIELETNSSRCGHRMPNNSSCASGISSKNANRYKRKLIVTPDWKDIAKGWIIRKPTPS